MKNKLKLVLWGKNFQLPKDYNNLEFDNYEFDYSDDFKQRKLFIYKNNKMIKQIWYWDNGNKNSEYNWKNGKFDGKGYEWYENGKLSYESNYKNGKFDGKQYSWWSGGELAYELNYKNGKI